MANQHYNYSSGNSGTGVSAYSSRFSTLSDVYKYDPALMASSRYLDSPADSSRYSALDRSSSALHLLQGDVLRLRSGDISRSEAAAAAAAHTGYSSLSWGGLDGLGSGASVTESLIAAGIKRHTEALYHQSVLGTHSTIGQSDALFPTNSLVKRPRIETASHLPIYPQRPGEKDCAHYMLTRTCKFGDACKFDHPIWVPEGGIPDWKEVPLMPSAESLPERLGEPDCPYFMKTQKCKFGNNCKFNHPKDRLTEMAEGSILPERPSEPICSFYAKTGKCKFGANCIFHHPKDPQIPIGQDSIRVEQNESVVNDGTTTGNPFSVKTSVPFTPALLHNSKGLPVRPGELDCPFYLKTGSCKYGATCRYNHPDRNAINPPVVGSVNTMFQSPSVINPSASFLPNIDPRLTQSALCVGSIIYPQRPGELECDFYMKTGHCKFADRCKFHHPVDRSAPSLAKQALQQNVKLTLAGLPRREGSIICPFYMKTGTCKFGATCRYDHPPPGEVIAMAASQGAATVADAAGESINITETVTQQHQY